MEGQVDGKLQDIEHELQNYFHQEPSPVLDRAILVVQSLRTMLKFGVGPQVVPVYQQGCEICKTTIDISAWDGDPRRFGVSMMHHHPSDRGDFMIPSLDGVSQPETIECLVSKQGWVLRYNGDLTCPVCLIRNGVMELVPGEVTLHYQPARAIVQPEIDSPAVTALT